MYFPDEYTVHVPVNPNEKQHGRAACSARAIQSVRRRNMIGAWVVCRSCQMMWMTGMPWRLASSRISSEFLRISQRNFFCRPRQLGCRRRAVLRLPAYVYKTRCAVQLWSCHTLSWSSVNPVAKHRVRFNCANCAYLKALARKISRIRDQRIPLVSTALVSARTDEQL